MDRVHRHPVAVTAIAFSLAIVAVLGIALAYGISGFGQAWSDLHPGWLALAALAELLSIPAYMLAYREVASLDGSEPLAAPLIARVVMAGFGPFAIAGGFALDKLALHALHEDEHSARVRVLGLGALEWALLAPAAWVCAVVMLADGNTQVMGSLLWPWAIAVPVGFAVGLWLSTPSRRRRLERGNGRARRWLGTALAGVGVLYELGRGCARCWSAWVGVTLYWALDIACLYGALRFVGLAPSAGEVILAYATGYALTRRSIPLGGAGVTEVLMTFALHWTGQPVLPALAAVVVYRVFNFVLPAAPALISHERLEPLLAAAEAGRPASDHEQEAAAAPLKGLGG